MAPNICPFFGRTVRLRGAPNTALILLQSASNAELWYFIWCPYEQGVGVTGELTHPDASREALVT